MPTLLPLLLLSESLAAPRVFLYTLGHDEALFTRWGHAALCLREEGGFNGACYGYGYTDFSDALGSVLRISRGKGLFWGDVEEEGELLSRYMARDADIWRQELILRPEEVATLQAALQASMEDGARVYSYHHFYDNCATRLRDPLDQATDGRLSEGALAKEGPPWREFAEKGLAGFLPLQVALQLSLGREGDQATSGWDRMFLPAELRREVERAYGAAPERLNTRQGPAIPDTPHQGRQAVAALGVVLAGALAAISRLRPSALWRAGGLLLGGLALLPWTVALVSNLGELRWNETLLLLWPTDLLLRRMSEGLRRAYLTARLGVLGVVAALWAAGLLLQPHGPTLLLVGLPLLLLRAAAGRRPARASQGAPSPA